MSAPKNYALIYFTPNQHTVPTIYSKYCDNGTSIHTTEFCQDGLDSALRAFDRMKGATEGTMLNFSQGRKCFVAKGKFHDINVSELRKCDEEGILTIRGLLFASMNDAEVSAYRKEVIDTLARFEPMGRAIDG